MASLEISYWTGTDAVTREVFGTFISAESLAVTASSAQSGVTPANAAIVRVTSAGAAARLLYGANPTAAASSLYLGADDGIDFAAVPGAKIAGITA